MLIPGELRDEALRYIALIHCLSDGYYIHILFGYLTDNGQIIQQCKK